MSEEELKQLKEEITKEIVSNLSISVNSTSWGSADSRTHEVSVQLFHYWEEISSSSIMLE